MEISEIKMIRGRYQIRLRFLIPASVRSYMGGSAVTGRFLGLLLRVLTLEV